MTIKNSYFDNNNVYNVKTEYKNIFFTADTHFGAERTRVLSRRPFKSVHHMDNAFVKEWNDKVPETGIVYHLGDFGDYDIIKRLNGKIRLICGNYEYVDINNQYNGKFLAFKQALRRLGFDNVFNSAKFEHKLILKDPVQTDENIEFTLHMNHEPYKMKKIDDRDLNLFAHIHNSARIKRNALNVGIDCHDYQILSLSDVLWYKNAIDNHYDENVYVE